MNLLISARVECIGQYDLRIFILFFYLMIVSMLVSVAVLFFDVMIALCSYLRRWNTISKFKWLRPSPCHFLYHSRCKQLPEDRLMATEHCSMSYPSPADLQSLSKDKVAANFESIPFAPEDRLTPATAKQLFSELPTSCAVSVCSFIDSEEFYKRCCTSLSRFGVRKEEHGFCFKRLFFEVRVPDLLQETMTLSRAIAENIFTVSLKMSRQIVFGSTNSSHPNITQILHVAQVISMSNRFSP